MSDPDRLLVETGETCETCGEWCDRTPCVLCRADLADLYADMKIQDVKEGNHATR